MDNSHSILRDKPTYVVFGVQTKPFIGVYWTEDIDLGIDGGILSMGGGAPVLAVGEGSVRSPMPVSPRCDLPSGI